MASRSIEGGTMTVLIADDHGLYRAGLCLLFKDQLGIGDVLEVGSLDEAIDLLARHEGIKLALFDLSMPGMAGPESLSAVKSTYPNTFVGVISGSEDRDNVLKCIAAGLSGYIPKSLSDDMIAKALEMMLAGSVFVPPLMMGSAPPLKPAAASPLAAPVPLSALTPRQRDVLTYIVQGRSNKEIARQLDIAEGTVKIHLAALFAHFGAHNRTELAMRAQALQHGDAPAPRGRN
jgi:DNA-binding NarL/FixJ family response regulator